MDALRQLAATPSAIRPPRGELRHRPFHVAELERLAEVTALEISEAASPITFEVLHAPLAEGLDRDAAVGLDAETRATAWASYGFAAGQVAAWLAAGVAEPPVAAELRAGHVDPEDDELAEEVDGMTWARAVDEGHRSVVDFLAYQETGRVA